VENMVYVNNIFIYKWQHISFLPRIYVKSNHIVRQAIYRRWPCQPNIWLICLCVSRLMY